jgi:RimJ/RimL family protein N-acetyltransferase/sulfatase maturation enzyme AslB (radical SAM superfamily)
MRQTAYIAINYDCNHHCLFCPHRNNPSRRSGAMSFADFKTAFDQILDQRPNLDSVTISGGEPTLNLDLMKMLHYVSEKNVRIGMFSNADRFSQISLVKELVKNVNLEKIQIISVIHSQEEKIHEKISGVKGSFSRTVCGLHNLLQEKVKVHLKNCINQLNYRDLTEYIDFVNQEFPLAAGVEFCGLDYCGVTAQQAREVAVNFREMGTALEKMLTFVEEKKLPLPVHIDDIPLCLVDEHFFPYFTGNKSNNEAYSSLDTKSKNEERVVFQTTSQCGTFSKKCRNCTLESRCSGSWRTAWQLFGDQALRPRLKKTTHFGEIMGQRISLRSVQDSDLPLIYNWDSDLSVRHFWHTEASIKPFFKFKEEFERNFLRDYHQFFLILNQEENAQPIGFIYSAKYDRENGHLDLSLYVAPKYRQGSLSSEAGILFCHHLFMNFPLRKIYVSSFSDNLASLSLTKSIGFIEEARLKEHNYHCGSYHDLVISALTKEKFFKKIEKLSFKLVTN